MHVRLAAAALVGVGLCLACSPSPPPAPSSPTAPTASAASASSSVASAAASSSAAPSASAASAAPSASAASAKACAKDADCTLFSDYCGGCTCRGLGPGDGQPRCPGKPVQCLVDPCLRKVAACEGGRCVARAGGDK